jgi:hypothetical protein
MTLENFLGKRMSLYFQKHKHLDSVRVIYHTTLFKKGVKLSDFKKWLFPVWCNMESSLLYELDDHIALYISKKLSFHGPWSG